jgi:hypothetical protein
MVHSWLFIRILPTMTAAVKMVNKSLIKETYSLMKSIILSLSFKFELAP